MATEKAQVSGLANNSLASDCVSAVAQCASLNGCFTQQGVLISDKCVETISRAVAKDRCLSQGFGLSKPRG